MSETGCRIRPTTLRFHVTEEEKKFLQDKMRNSSTPNMDQYLRMKVFHEIKHLNEDIKCDTFLLSTEVFYEQTIEFMQDMCSEMKSTLAQAKALKEAGAAYLEELRKFRESTLER